LRFLPGISAKKGHKPTGVIVQVKAGKVKGDKGLGPWALFKGDAAGERREEAGIPYAYAKI
jgi:hypothetical protein